MALRKYVLARNAEKGVWDLKREGSGRATESFATKEAALAGGVMEKILGKDGGSVRIRTAEGKFSTARVYPGWTTKKKMVFGKEVAVKAATKKRPKK